MFREAEAFEVRRQTPAGAAFGDVLAHGLVVHRLGGKLVDAGPHGVAFGFGAAGDAFGHRVEMLMRLEHGAAGFVRSREGHEADLLGGEIQIFGQIGDKILAAEDADDFALHEKVRHFVRQREDG